MSKNADAGGDEEKPIEWTLSVEDLTFSTTVRTEDMGHGAGDKVVEVAQEELIEALQKDISLLDGSDDVYIRWSKSATDPETRERHAAMDEALRCEHCEDITQQEKREIVVGDEVEFVCPDCADELRDTCNECERTREELDEEETIEVTTNPDHRGVVEFLCSSCAADRD